VSNELRRTIGKRFDGNELTALIELLEKKKDNEFKVLQKKVEDASKSHTRFDVEKEKEQI
jgi:prephenate dehydratase